MHRLQAEHRIYRIRGIVEHELIDQMMVIGIWGLIGVDKGVVAQVKNYVVEGSGLLWLSPVGKDAV